ncbi:hypothetical protein OPV22_012657 [Ensete ventricosum]|uniref:Auxin-responsive protein n=1 Tax=Ensete ventricosum TaxID=4639 RepID=A0AAV8R821_ENSVE|nr:hypothetical protein OPV22_012657 [Ensete ventricosum]
MRFVKVHKQGCAIARRINLKAHDDYESLRRALEDMFRDFLSSHKEWSDSVEVLKTNACIWVSADRYHPHMGSEEEDTGDVHIIYENHEGERMLITDVAWEVFVNTAKRLYIVKNPEAAAANW